MQRVIIVAVVAVLLILGAIGFMVWQHLNQLSGQLTDLSQQVDDLGDKATTAEARAAEAEARADRAQQAAGEAADRAVEAVEREQQSLEEAEQARVEREAAVENERQAQEERERAELLAQMAERAQEAAEEKQAAAERQAEEVARQAEQAEEEARQAKAETEKVRQRLKGELDRLQASLSKIADTRRTALGLVMTLDSRQIEFDFDKSELRPENREVLARIAGVLLTYQNYGIQVFGHTDDVGSVDYNQQLSEKRADSVREYLVEAGIDPDVMSTKGLGKSSPLVEGSDPESRQRNRRVELAIVLSEGEFEAIQQGDEQ